MSEFAASCRLSESFADVTLDAVETMVGKEQFVPTLPRMLELIQAQLSVGGRQEGQFLMRL